MQTCSLSAPINVVDVLHQLLPLRRKPACEVANRQIPMTVRSGGVGAATLREVNDWSAAIIFRTLVGAAEQRLPGIAVLHHACQLYRALNEAQRGEIVRALQHLPVTALVPAVVLEVLGEVARGILPQMIHQIPDHEALVLGLAAAALLYGAQAAPESAESGSSAHWGAALRCIRLTVGTLRGMRNLLSMVPPTAGHLRLAGPTPSLAADGIPSPARNGTGMIGTQPAWMASGDLLHIAEAGTLPVSAWPFDGALAAARGRTAGRARTQGHRHRHGGASHGHAGRKSTSTARRRVQVHHRHGTAGGDGDRPRDYRGARGNQAARNPTAMSGHGEGQKEALQNPLSHASSKVFREGSRKLERERQTQNAPGAHHGNGLAPSKIKPGPAQVAAGRSVLEGAGRATVTRDRLSLTGAALHCLTFNDVKQAIDEVKRAGHRHSLPRFCMHPKAVGVFNATFDGAEGLHWDAGGWMVTHTIAENVPDPLRSVRIWKSAINAQQAPVVSEGAALGSDTLVSVAIISPSGSLGQESSGEQDPRYLPRNSFRLLKYADADGRERLFMAYYICRDVPGERGVKAGFLPLHHRPGEHVEIHDMGQNLTITTDSLATLVDVMEKTTGLGHYVAEPHPVGDEADEELAEWALPLLVDEDTLSADLPHTPLPYDASLELFPVTQVKGPDDGQMLVLYRNTFVSIDHEILYADAEGRTGTLLFGYPSVDGGPSRLYGFGDGHEAFARQQGLEIGGEYTVSRIIEKLELNGMFAMPTTPARNAPRTIAGSVDSTVDGSGDSTAGDLALPPSSFRFDARSVRFTDHDGRRGVLLLEKADASAPMSYRLQENQETLDLLFAERLLIREHLSYSEEDIVALLHGEGFVRMRP